MTDLPILPTLPILPAEDEAPAAAEPAAVPAEVILPPLPAGVPAEENAAEAAPLPAQSIPGEVTLPADDAETALIPSGSHLPVTADPESRIPDSGLAPFTLHFAGRECHSRLDLADAMADAWDEARRALLTGELANDLDAFDLVAAAICRDQTAGIAAGRCTPDRAVLEAIRRLSEMPLVIWCGRRYAGAGDLGGSLLQALRGTGVIPVHLDSLLLGAAASVFCEPEQTEGLHAIEARYAAPDCTPREKLLLMYMVGFLLGGMAAYVIEGETFYTVEELAAWLESRAKRSPAAFTRACHRLLDENHLPDPQLEAWLTALGHRQDVVKWQAEIDAGML